MYATIRRYRVPADAMDALLHEIDTGFAEDVQELDGFMAYECLDCGNGMLMTISMFMDRAMAEASTLEAAKWIANTLGDRYDIERLDATTGEVCVSRAREGMLEPAHH